MPEFDMRLDDAKHRSFKLNKELCDTAAIPFSVTVVYKMSPSGNKTNYLVIRSLAGATTFTDLEIPVDFKIPPRVDP